MVDRDRKGEGKKNNATLLAKREASDGESRPQAERVSTGLIYRLAVTGEHGDPQTAGTVLRKVYCFQNSVYNITLL